jgi:hypothetical protein
MEIRTVVGLIGIVLIVGPIVPPLVQVFILYYQMVFFHTMSSSEYLAKMTPLIVDLLTPTEYTIYSIFGKYGFYVVGGVLILYWYLTGQFNNNR